MKNLFCHNDLKSSIYYVDDRLFYKFLKEIIGETSAKKTYLQAYQRTFGGKQINIENHWAFEEPINLYGVKQLPDIITSSLGTQKLKIKWMQSLFH